MRRITIEFGPDVHGGTEINVIDEYGRETGRLCFGEMLEQVAGLVAAEMPPLRRERYPMLTPEGWREREERITNLTRRLQQQADA